MKKSLGKVIHAVRPMTKYELRKQGWDEDAHVLCIEIDGAILFPAKDNQGSGPGALKSAHATSPIRRAKTKDNE